MKKILLALAMLAIPLFAFSQHECIEKFYNKYISDEKVTDISLDGWILSLAAKMTDEEGTEILEKVTKLRIMVAEDKNVVPKADIKQLMRDVRKNQFEDLLTVREEDTRVNFMIREEGDKITNVLVVVHGADEFVLLSLEGSLDFDELRELDFDVEGGNIFKKLPNKRA
ncbi:MAG: DUF4252 domain-containing protein [Bacteroidota bacterium]